MLATAGGMKKSTEIEIGVGTFYAGGLLIGSVGAGRAYFRKKASDRRAAEVLDIMKGKVVNQSQPITWGEEIKTVTRPKTLPKKYTALSMRCPSSCKKLAK